jgi:hypothetical protein
MQAVQETSVRTPADDVAEKILAAFDGTGIAMAIILGLEEVAADPNHTCQSHPHIDVALRASGGFRLR